MALNLSHPHPPAYLIEECTYSLSLSLRAESTQTSIYSLLMWSRNCNYQDVERMYEFHLSFFYYGLPMLSILNSIHFPSNNIYFSSSWSRRQQTLAQHLLSTVPCVKDGFSFLRGSGLNNGFWVRVLSLIQHCWWSVFWFRLWYLIKHLLLLPLMIQIPQAMGGKKLHGLRNRGFSKVSGVGFVSISSIPCKYLPLLETPLR